ncbi:MAG: hypothetical protein ACJ797_08250 [Ktedonobacteraceae bacterium]
MNKQSTRQRTRQERRREEQLWREEEQRRAARRKRITITGIIAAGVLLVAGLVYLVIGVIHIEAPNGFSITLKNFLDIWENGSHN